MQHACVGMLVWATAAKFWASTVVPTDKLVSTLYSLRYDLLLLSET
jgi:hypothetical protein